MVQLTIQVPSTEVTWIETHHELLLTGKQQQFRTKLIRQLLKTTFLRTSPLCISSRAFPYVPLHDAALRNRSSPRTLQII